MTSLINLERATRNLGLTGSRVFNNRDSFYRLVWWRAFVLARISHGSNTEHTYFGMPFYNHLHLVNTVFLDYFDIIKLTKEGDKDDLWFKQVVAVSIWLHDILEDTHLNYNDVKDMLLGEKKITKDGMKLFANNLTKNIPEIKPFCWEYIDSEQCLNNKQYGLDNKVCERYLSFVDDVMDTVYRVTDELGKNRAERAAKTYPKIAESKLAIFMKLCDRIANVRFSKAAALLGLDSHMLAAYTKQLPLMKESFGPDKHPEFAPMWDELDNLTK